MNAMLTEYIVVVYVTLLIITRPSSNIKESIDVLNLSKHSTVDLLALMLNVLLPTF